MNQTATVAPRRTDRRFYAVMTALIALTVFAGFAPSFYLRPLFESKGLSGILALHGTVFSAWVVLLVSQVWLVSAKRTDIHRKLGILGGALAATMLVVGVLASIDSAKRGFSPPGAPPALSFMLISMADMVVFPPLVGAALYWRRRSDVHKRLMLVATMAILTPAIARVAFIKPYGLPAYFGIADLFILGAMVWDRVRNGRFHPAFVWGAVFVIASQVLRIVFCTSPGWLMVARWLTR